MASSTSTGDRRWASARRGGMTVLGKVAVPKPINLPSQRLENHGLDPTVEIVPKGTLSWGSRPSSSTSNAWGSSSLSPNADSSANSPSRLSARPSSGGGTRPSTAGSDKVHDSTPNVWSSNSRPSSASGALTSTQASLASLRPRSAEPRPGSSQLSRFADHPSDISVAGSRERLVVSSLKNDGFSLSTGDFPSLGAVKSSSTENTVSEDPAFHDSGSTGGVAPSKEGSESYSVGDASLHIEGKSRVENSWRRDNPPYGEDGSREKWNGDTPPSQNSGILPQGPQHFNAWRGPPVNNPPGGGWYRGPSGGPPPYGGGPVPPSGFPVESFHYFHPQVPASALPNPQQVPQAGTGPRGPHPKSGEMYRPQMPDAYIRPGMPVRPGFYPGPVPYDGYFGHPPMGYCGPNDRDIPIMGMTGGPPSIYGQHPSQNAPDAGNSHIRPPGRGSNNKVHGSEEVVSGHHHDPQPYRVLLKPHDNWNQKSEQQKSEGTQRSSVSSMEKVDRSGASSWENDNRADRMEVGEKDVEGRAVGVRPSSQNFDSNSRGSFLPSKAKTPENTENAKVDREHARAEQKNFVAADGPQSFGPQNSSLIQKIEGLNAKARASDQRPDVMFISDRPEQGNKWQVHDVKASRPAADVGQHAPYPPNLQTALGRSTEEKVLEETAVGGPNTSRRYPHGGQGKAHHHHRGRGRSEDVDGFRNKAVVLEPLLPIPSESSGVQRETHPPSQTRRKFEGGHVPVTSGPGDNQAERARIKEQRLKQRQEEEEERAREQKAKAQMKLEELNKRMQVLEGPNSKTESSISNNPQDLAPSSEPKATPNRSASSSSTSVPRGDLIPQTSQARDNPVGRSSRQSKEFPQEPSKVACKEPAIVHNQPDPVKQDAADADNCIVAPPIHATVTSKQHRTGYKQKQNTMPEKNTSQKIAAEAPKSQVDVADDVTTTVDIGADSSAHQKRRSNRGHRSKLKGDESSVAKPSLSLAPKESGGASSASTEGVKLKASDAENVHGFVRTMTEPDDTNQPLEQRPGSAHEEAHVRGNNQWKSQASRRAPRNQQINRAADKFHGGDGAVWAPVRSQNKIEVADESSDRTEAEGQSLTVKSDQPLQNNNPRNKRAEIERYVPKPVAKEMAQQESAHQQKAASGSPNKTEDEAVQLGDSGSSAVAGKELRNADGRQNRSARGHGAWRQRGTADTVPLQVSSVEQTQSHFSQSSASVQRQPEHHQGPKLEERHTKERIKHHDEREGLTISSDSSYPASQAQVPAAGRDQGIPGRGKRHPPLKGPKGSGYSIDPDQKKSSTELERSRNPSVAPEVSQTDSAAEASQTDRAAAAPTPRENHSVVDRSTLHWQPKSRAVSGQSYRPNKAAIGGRITAETIGVPTEDVSKAHHEACDQSTITKDEIHEEAGKREKKPRSFAARPQSPSQGPLKLHESADEHHEAEFSSGPRKNGNQNPNRFGRGEENRGDWNSSWQDSRQHNASSHRERQRYNPNYKYQPVGTYSNENKFEGPREGFQNTGPKYKERPGQSTSRHGGGNSYERQVGNA